MQVQKYGWKQHKRCKKCKYRSDNDNANVYGCEYALVTGQTRTAIIINQHTDKPSDYYLKPANCPFYEAGPKADTRSQIALNGDKRMRIDDEKAKALHSQGMTDFEIADALGCAQSTVKRFRKRYGLIAHQRKTIVTEEMRKAIEQLYNAGASDEAMARKIGCSSKVIRKWRDDNNKPSNFLSGGKRRG